MDTEGRDDREWKMEMPYISIDHFPMRTMRRESGR